MSESDYFRYFPQPPELSIWGMGVTAAGHAGISPGAAYPPPQHPDGYDFNWEAGRVLDSLQIICICAGGGWLETAATGCVRVEAGMAFVLLPHIWHRYRPDGNTGWVENWIELGGPVIESLIASKTLTEKETLCRVEVRSGVALLMEEIQEKARGAIGFQPDMSAATMSLLALWTGEKRIRLAPTGIQQAVLEAQRYLDVHYAEAVDLEALSSKLGVAYSHLRREFRARSGLAPWQYVIHLRLIHAKRLLASSEWKLDDIAGRLGFSSGFHLSLAFKKAFGKPPVQWRKDLKA